jgi:hypothetical protein
VITLFIPKIISMFGNETEARKLAALKAHDEDADAFLTPANAL